MANITIDVSATSNGVRSDIVGVWNDARTDPTAKEITNFITQASTAFQCGRYFGFFDLSGIPAGATINSAKIVHP